MRPAIEPVIRMRPRAGAHLIADSMNETNRPVDVGVRDAQRRLEILIEKGTTQPTPGVGQRWRGPSRTATWNSKIASRSRARLRKRTYARSSPPLEEHGILLRELEQRARTGADRDAAARHGADAAQTARVAIGEGAPFRPTGAVARALQYWPARASAGEHSSIVAGARLRTERHDRSQSSLPTPRAESR